MSVYLQTQNQSQDAYLPIAGVGASQAAQTILTTSQIREIFALISERASSFPQNQQEALQCCGELHRYIQRLEAYTNAQITLHHNRQEAFRASLLRFQDQYTSLSIQLSGAHNQHAALQARSAGLEEQVRALQAQVDQKLQEALSFQALGGVFGSSGLLADLAEQKRRALNSSKEELRAAKANQSTCAGSIASIQREMQRIQDEIGVKEKEIRGCGQQITKLSNIVSSLQRLGAKYRFLSDQVSLVQEFIQIGDQGLIQAEMSQFQHDCANIQPLLLQVVA